MTVYYMASAPSGKDKPNRELWLATRCILQAKFHQKPYNKSFIDQACSVKMAGYWPRSFFACKKKNLANIQPSWPHTWSITHTYWPHSFFVFVDLDSVLVHKHAEKDQYPAILTSHLVSNPFTQCMMLVISLSQGKFYSKNQIIVLLCYCVSVLASMLHCLFPATAVVQDRFDEFILEFIWLVICIYALWKISRFAWYSCVAVWLGVHVLLISNLSHLF